MKIEGSTALVTGAGGFIGSHLVSHLVARDVRVKALVHYNSLGSNGWLDALPPELVAKLEVIPGDVRDAPNVRRAMTGCNVVFHLAALIGIPYSYVAADSYVDTNIRGTLNVLEAARALGVSRVVHTSTSEVYGTAQYVPIDESHPLNAQSPYAATKIGADCLASSFFRSFNLPVTIVRPFNTYGPRQSTRAVIPTVIVQLLHGDVVKLGSLHPMRDFNYVSDTARGFIAAAESEQATGETIQLATNFSISVEDTARLIAEQLGKPLKIDGDDQRLRPAGSEVDRLWGTSDKATRLMNWTPMYAGVDGLKRGLAETIEWFRNPTRRRDRKDDAYHV